MRHAACPHCGLGRHQPRNGSKERDTGRMQKGIANAKATKQHTGTKQIPRLFPPDITWLIDPIDRLRNPHRRPHARVCVRAPCAAPSALSFAREATPADRRGGRREPAGRPGRVICSCREAQAGAPAGTSLGTRCPRSGGPRACRAPPASHHIPKAAGGGRLDSCWQARTRARGAETSARLRALPRHARQGVFGSSLWFDLGICLPAPAARTPRSSPLCAWLARHGVRFSHTGSHRPRPRRRRACREGEVECCVASGFSGVPTPNRPRVRFARNWQHRRCTLTFD
jgi:hypothetical protein